LKRQPTDQYSQSQNNISERTISEQLLVLAVQADLPPASANADAKVMSRLSW
jgi:hypothetical protein